MSAVESLNVSGGISPDFGQSVTVYNLDKKAGVWYPVVLSGVSCHEKKAANFSDAVKKSENLLEMRVPYATTVRLGQMYAPQDVWQSEENKTAVWTLQLGDKVVLGDVSSTEGENIDVAEIIPPKDALTISAFWDNRRGPLCVAHWRVEAK